MRITTFLLLVCVFCSFAENTHSQNARVSISKRNAQLEEILTEIESQTDYLFIYNNQVDVNRKVSVKVKNEPVSAVLKSILKNSDIDFEMEGTHIVLTKTGKTEVEIRKQTRKINGTILDSNGEPIIGANVVEKGTRNGTITDQNGHFSLVVQPNASVVISYIGFESQTHVVTGNVLNVVMSEDSQALNEVVVVGYGTRKAGEITGAVSTVKAGEIQKLAITNAGEALKNVAGVTTLQSNTPGAEPTILIRGIGTINDSRPLWIVDGVPDGKVNPNNIETITILKDAASQAIYGTRAANGVILVTTKSGKKNQKAHISVNLRSGFVQNTNHYKMLNTQEYGEMLWLQAKNGGIANYSHPLYGSGATPDIPDYIFPNRGVNVDESLYDDKMINQDGTDTYLITKANKQGTNWAKEIERTAQYHDVSVDISGGSENTIYAFQSGYLKQEGVLKWTGMDRYNLQSNIVSDVTKWLQVGENLGVTYSETYGNMVDNSQSSIISQAYRMQPIIPVYDIGGNFAGTRVGGDTGNARNPVGLLYNDRFDKRKTMAANGNAFVKITPISGLNLKSLFGFVYSYTDYKNIDYVDLGWAERTSVDQLTREESYTKQWNWTNTADYSKQIDAHDFTILVGTEAIANIYTFVTAGRSDYMFKDPLYIELNTGSSGRTNYGNISEWSLFSVFGRVNYSYDDKYLFEGVIRRDGSSRFGGNNKYGTFPAFSLGWRVSNEEFMKSTRNWLTSLKLRGGYGVTGNDRIGNYNSFSQFGMNNWGSYYDITGANNTEGQFGFYQTTFGNMNVKWETTHTSNFGFDATLFEHLSVGLDIWKRNTKDMLFPKAIPMVMGDISAPYVNVGKMKNKGIDFEIGYNGTALGNELRYSLNASISHYKNEIVDLSGEEDETLNGGSFENQFYTRAEKGTSFPEFYGYVVDGIFQTAEEAAAWPTAFGSNGSYNKPGHYKYRDISGPDGTPDGVINEYDRTYIGSPHPKFVGGLNFTIEYKGFDLSGQFYGSYGNKAVNFLKRFTDYSLFSGGRGYDRLYNSWGSPYLSDNSKAKLPIAESNDTESQVPSTAFIEDASFLRLRNLMLGYDFARLLKQPGITNLRVFAQVSNVFTLTKYSGLDPEINMKGTGIDAAKNLGIDSGSWPTPRQVLFGVSLGF